MSGKKRTSSSTPCPCEVSNVADDIPGIVFQILKKEDGTLSFPFFSDTAKEALGLDDKDISNAAQGIIDFLKPEDLALLAKILKKSEKNLSSFSHEININKKDGTVIELSGLSKPKKLEDGKILWNTVLYDITESKKLEHRLKMILDNAPDGIIIANADGIISSANRATLRIFGRKKEELIGQNLTFILGDKRYKNGAKNKALFSSSLHEECGCHKDGSILRLEVSSTEYFEDGQCFFIIIIRDITGKARAEANLREAEERINTIISALPCCLYKGTIYKNKRKVVLDYVSDTIENLLSVKKRDILEDSSYFYDAFLPEYKKNLLANHKVLLRSKRPKNVDKEVQLKNGKWVLLNANPTKTPEGDISWNGIIFDVTDKQTAKDRLHFLAYHDSLTGVGNKELLYKYFQDFLATAKKNKTQIAVLSLAPDGLGQINAVSGHNIGDLVLTKIAQRLAKALDKDDLLVRMAGHRFIVIFPNLSNRYIADKKIGQIMHAFYKPISVEKQEFDVTLTIGVCFYPSDGMTPDSLISHADAALDMAKNNNRGSATIFSEELSARLSRSMYLRTKMRSALEKGEIIPFFQPQVSVKTGEIEGVEALARWRSKEGMICPAEFISVAEEYGFIEELTCQIMREACLWSKNILDKGLGRIPVAVNISAHLFQNYRKLFRMIKQILKDTKLPPELLELELTESTAMVDPQTAIAVINKLGEDGVSCSIDDFGTGYSSLSVLKSFPLKKLKIDRSFVVDLTEDKNDAAIVRATIAIARALNLVVLAEGVETKRHFDLLKELGCDSIQGYLFARPMSASEAETFVRDWNAKQVFKDLNS